MKAVKQPLKSVSIAVTTKKQHVICFVYSDDVKQNSIDFIRDIARLHDNSEEYSVSVKMYSDFNVLHDKVDIITDDVLTVITFVSMYINSFIKE